MEVPVKPTCAAHRGADYVLAVRDRDDVVLRARSRARRARRSACWRCVRSTRVRRKGRVLCILSSRRETSSQLIEEDDAWEARRAHAENTCRTALAHILRQMTEGMPDTEIEFI